MKILFIYSVSPCELKACLINENLHLDFSAKCKFVDVEHASMKNPYTISYHTFHNLSYTHDNHEDILSDLYNFWKSNGQIQKLVFWKDYQDDDCNIISTKKYHGFNKFEYQLETLFSKKVDHFNIDIIDLKSYLDIITNSNQTHKLSDYVREYNLDNTMNSIQILCTLYQQLYTIA